MKKNTGLWIDHMEAIIVSIENGESTVHRVDSGAESHFKPSGGWKSGGTNVAQAVSNEHTSEESRKHQYHAFFLKVIDLLEDSSKIAIFGPGEAKVELNNEIEKHKELHKKVTVVEPCERITENQLITKVKTFFSVDIPRQIHKEP